MVYLCHIANARTWVSLVVHVCDEFIIMYIILSSHAFTIHYSHNLGLGHSGMTGDPYGDQSGVMGRSRATSEVPRMCFKYVPRFLLSCNNLPRQYKLTMSNSPFPFVVSAPQKVSNWVGTTTRQKDSIQPTDTFKMIKSLPCPMLSTIATQETMSLWKLFNQA